MASNWLDFISKDLPIDCWLVNGQEYMFAVQASKPVLHKKGKPEDKLPLSANLFVDASLLSPFTIQLYYGYTLQARHHSGATPYNLEDRAKEYGLKLRTDGSSFCLRE
jgi:hypothetical protein